MRGPFARHYDGNAYLYWWLWALVIVYTVLLVVWIAVSVNSVAITHTYFKNPGAPGAQLDSLRGSFTTVALRIGIIFNMIALAWIISMIAYRNNVVLSIGFFVLFVIGAVVAFFTMVALSDQYSHCNGQNQWGNLCNAPNYCCAHEIWTNPDNGCPNTFDCATPLTIDDLAPNDNFLSLFWIHFVLLLLHIAYIVTCIVGWRMLDSTQQNGEDVEEPEPEKTVVEQPPAAAAAEFEKQPPAETPAPEPVGFNMSSSLVQPRRKRPVAGLRKRIQ